MLQGTTSPPPKPILALETGEQSGERDVAIAAVAPTKALVDNVGEGGAPLLAEVELSNAVEGGVEAEREVERVEALLHGKSVLEDKVEFPSNRSGS
jgi:hypothetical protein